MGVRILGSSARKQYEHYIVPLIFVHGPPQDMTRLLTGWDEANRNLLSVTAIPMQLASHKEWLPIKPHSSNYALFTVVTFTVFKRGSSLLLSIICLYGDPMPMGLFVQALIPYSSAV